MKKTAFAILLVSFAASCTKMDNTFIEGTLAGGERRMVWLDYLNINKAEKTDSVKLNNKGVFRFKINLDHPGIYMLRNEEGRLISLLPSPGEKIELKGDYMQFDRQYSLSGSAESEKVKILTEKLSETRGKLGRLDETFASLKNVSEEQASEYIAQRKSIISEQKAFSIHFIVTNLQSLAGIYAVYQNLSPGEYVLGENKDIQYMKILADTLSRYYPEVPLVKSFVSDARESEKTYYTMRDLSEKMKDARAGLPDLRIPNLKGDTISLESSRKKATLLLFWAAGDQNSLRLMPELMSIYGKYRKKGFEIYAVSLDQRKDVLEKAISFYELNWINVCEFTYPESLAATIYNVNKVPTAFLMNSDGEIIARDITGRELEKWLDNLLP